jgi:7-carboxy-7-deazaguanine synthase
VNDQSLYLIELYESIQGETSLTGCMSSFIRLAGCPLRCRWCDSAFTFSKGEKTPLSSIMGSIEHFGWQYVCITGGEPLLQPSVIPLMERLVSKKYVVSLETNGAFSTEKVPIEVKVILDVKCPQSGMSEKNEWSNLHRLHHHDEIKFVIADKNDYEWAKQVIKKYSLFDKAGEILFSPVFGELHPKDLVAWMAKDHLQARLNLQVHKFVWEPATRGV